MDNSSDMYDEPMTDQDPREGGDNTDQTDTENAGDPFLAPKSALPDNPEVGAIYTVRVDRILDTEVQLVCTGASDKNTTQPAAAPADENASLYE